MPPPERRPYSLPDPRVERLRAQVQAQEDEEIFRQLDRIATVGWAGTESVIVPAHTQNIHVTTTALRPGEVYAVTEPEQVQNIRGLPPPPDLYFPGLPDISWVRNPMDRAAELQAPILPEPAIQDVFRQEYLGQFTEGEPVARPTLGWTIGQVEDQSIVNERALGRRVHVPLFEMFSSPTFRVEDIRRRRFDLIDREHPISAAFKRILSGLFRSKIPEITAPPPQEPRKHLTYWEALVELDLVDDESSPP